MDNVICEAKIKTKINNVIKLLLIVCIVLLAIVLVPVRIEKGESDPEFLTIPATTTYNILGDCYVWGGLGGMGGTELGIISCYTLLCVPPVLLPVLLIVMIPHLLASLVSRKSRLRITSYKLEGSIYDLMGRKVIDVPLQYIDNISTKRDLHCKLYGGEKLIISFNVPGHRPDTIVCPWVQNAEEFRVAILDQIDIVRAAQLQM